MASCSDSQKNLPYAHIPGPTSDQTVTFVADDFSVITADPRALLVRVSSSVLRCIVIACHAPHTGNSLDEIEEWWTHLHSQIPAKYDTWPRLLLTDANACVGHDPTDHIGDFQIGPFEAKSQPFETFVKQNDLWLPATFAASQHGPGCTWTHSSGSKRRIDYVGLPRTWVTLSCKAWVSEIIDASITRTDHVAPCVEAIFLSKTFDSHARPPFKLHLPAINEYNLDALRLVAHTSHDTNVHTHAAVLQKQLCNALRPFARAAAQCPRKQTMSAPTWSLVQAKRKQRAHLAHLNDVQRSTMLEAVFAHWKSLPHADASLSALTSGFTRLLAMQDKLIAVALAEFRRLGRSAAVALRKDDCEFYQGLLSEGADFLHPHDVKRLWNVLRRSIPKFKHRKLYLAPARIEALEEQIVPHFCALELGKPIDPDALVNLCHQRQLVEMQQWAGVTVNPADLPSLTDVETALRSTQANKATGLDPIPSRVHHDCAPVLARFYYPLILKMHLWCVEPIQYKGGIMTLIPKKGDPHVAANYRGILLLASIAKRVHGLLRTSLMTTLHPQRVEGQLGGFAKQMVQFGFHAVTM